MQIYMPFSIKLRKNQTDKSDRCDILFSLQGFLEKVSFLTFPRPKICIYQKFFVPLQPNFNGIQS